MKLKRLNILESDKTETGLIEGVAEFRPSLILLAGKNGSGKTRALNLIKKKIFATGKFDYLTNIPPYMANKSGGNYEKYKKHLVLHFTPDIIRLIQSNLQNSNTISNHSFDTLIESGPNEFDGNELDLLVGTAINHFYKLPTIYLLKKASYSSDQDRNWKATKVFQRFNSLQKKFRLFLGKELECVFDESIGKANYAADGSASGIKATWLLDGRAIKYEELSDGEKTLLSYILLLYLQEQYPYSKAKDSIILIDEPETHLHPQAQIKLIKGLIELTKEKGQLIVATHSIPIISICNSDNIYFLKKSKIYPPGSRIPNEVLEDLVGVEEINTHLQPLLTNMSEWAINSFLIDCFAEPEVIEESSNSDPQFIQLLEFLKNIDNPEILDFGAGKGRLANLLGENKTLDFQVDVFEPNKELEIFLNNNENIRNYFNDVNKIKERYDVVLLSNVLHEILPTQWIKTVNKIKTLLKDDGYLLILEDLQLRKGECPHKYGYLVLESGELEILLNFNGESIAIEPFKDTYKGRLQCTAFSKSHLSKSTKKNLELALNKLIERSYAKAIDYRSNGFYKEGRTYAFYSQQYLNAIHTLNEIKADNKR